MTRVERIRGCLLGGAVGDALGAPVEFMDWLAIRAQFGPDGIADFVPVYGRLGAVTDDSQMMLFTAEGLLRAYVRGSTKGICHVPSVIHHALMRWYVTQGGQPLMEVGQDGWLIEQQELWSRRAPGLTCLSALRGALQFGELAKNDSKGCGGVMRVAPCAFFGNAFEFAADSTQLTHGHPTGYLAAGMFADILQRLDVSGCALQLAINQSLEAYGQQPGMDETRLKVERVLSFYHAGTLPTPEGIAELGGGWIAEEALSIGLWCALMAETFEQGVLWAVNHSGDSDSTGLIAGHLLGMQFGGEGIPERWLCNLELREVIEQVAEDIERVPQQYCGDGGEHDDTIWTRYPGW